LKINKIRVALTTRDLQQSSSTLTISKKPLHVWSGFFG